MNEHQTLGVYAEALVVEKVFNVFRKHELQVLVLLHFCNVEQGIMVCQLAYDIAPFVAEHAAHGYQSLHELLAPSEHLLRHRYRHQHVEAVVIDVNL